MSRKNEWERAVRAAREALEFDPPPLVETAAAAGVRMSVSAPDGYVLDVIRGPAETGSLITVAVIPANPKGGSK